MNELRTDRLLLRRWTERDRAAFHALNSDPAVMATIGPVMSRGESDAFMNRIEARFDELGYSLWCVEPLDGDGEPIGFTGLAVPWFRDGVEVGWRIRSEFWGRDTRPRPPVPVSHTGSTPSASTRSSRSRRVRTHSRSA